MTVNDIRILLKMKDKAQLSTEEITYIRLKYKAPVSSYNSKNEATLGRFRLRFLAINYKTSIFHNFFPLIFCLIYKNNETGIIQILSKKSEKKVQKKSRIKIFLKKRKAKIENMVMNAVKISKKTKSQSQLSIERDIMKCPKITERWLHKVLVLAIKVKVGYFQSNIGSVFSRKNSRDFRNSRQI